MASVKRITASAMGLLLRIKIPCRLKEKQTGLSEFSDWLAEARYSLSRETKQGGGALICKCRCGICL